jgi:murein L,D-transpeptidase YcbB/YkuD
MHPRSIAPIVLLVAASIVGCVGRRPPVIPDGATESAFARSITAALSALEPSGLDGESIDVWVLRRIYADRRSAPFWTNEAGETDARAEEIVAVIADAASEGLDARDYHADAIRRLLANQRPGDAVALELLLSDGVVRYATHQRSGVSPPPAHAASLARDDPDPATILHEVATSDAGARLRAFAPAHEAYRKLRDALAFHRGVETQGGWPTVPDRALRPGMTDPAVAVLRRRLVMSGDLDDGAGESRRYDDDLVTAVRHFQWRYGIGPDGVAGKSTVAAMNVSVGERIEQIIANMERWRWFGRELGERYVKVNVPDYSLVLVQNGSPVLAMPVVVGKKDWRTPVITSEIERAIFNPSWTVPSSIANKEILPKARADAGYLARQGIVARRTEAPPESSDPGTPATLRLRQAPGPQNPLGRVKFEMPNPFGVYLHDTPSRRGFARSRRALSHGCIRLKDPLRLADALLAGTDGWSDERREEILSTWRTTSIELPTPVPVYVQYETAWIDELGALHVREDIYERDGPLRRQMADAGRAPLDERSRARRNPEPPVSLTEDVA